MKIENFVILLVVCLTLFLISCVPAIGDEDAKAVATTHPEVVYDIGCVECHTTETPEITQQWSSSAHGKMNIGCYVCHGDGDVEFNTKPNSENCISCHSSSEEHYEEIEGELCFECHDGHSLSAD